MDDPATFVVMAMNKLTAILYALITLPCLPIAVGMALYQDYGFGFRVKVWRTTVQTFELWLDDWLTIGGWKEWR